MVGIVIASHGRYGDGLVDALELLTGKQERVCAVGLRRGEVPDDYKRKLQNAIAGVDDGDGTLVLVDLFGGTPSNVTAQSLLDPNVSAIAGVNLAMLLDVVFSRDEMNLSELTSEALTAGHGGIVDIRQKLSEVDAENDDADF